MKFKDYINEITDSGLRNKFDDIMDKKPGEWPTTAELDKKYVKDLPVFKDIKVYGKPIQAKSSPTTIDFKNPDDIPVWFVLKTKFGDFLINTEGFGYVRYVAKLK